MIIRSISLLILLFSTISTSWAQQGRTLNWVLGESVLIDFSSGIPITGESAIDSFEGLSVISDTEGNLQFYTDGITVWNANHLIMSNGTGLLSSYTATNAALIVPLPLNKDIYYIFTVAGQAGYGGSFGGAAYSIVDMSLNDGLGEIIEKNTILQTKTTEKLCGTQHENNIDYWINLERFFLAQKE